MQKGFLLVSDRNASFGFSSQCIFHVKGLQKIHSQRKCSRGAFLHGIESDPNNIIWKIHFHFLLPGIEIHKSDLQNILWNLTFYIYLFLPGIVIHESDLQNILQNFHFFSLVLKYTNWSPKHSSKLSLSLVSQGSWSWYLDT